MRRQRFCARRPCPDIPMNDDVLFAAMMLWGYGVILAVLILFGDKLVRAR